MYKFIKRASDFIISAILIIIFLPVWTLIPLCILVTMKRPVLYKQKRIGLNNREFEIIKFRSMSKKSPAASTDAQRITKMGRILRITRIDELPQLYNIIIGDMSFIGPRPLLPEYLPFYTSDELRRHDVRPGLSGLSQISGSYQKWEEQFILDIQYVNSLSFINDLRIFAMTLRKVFKPSQKLITGNPGRERFDVYRMNQNKSTT